MTETDDSATTVDAHPQKPSYDDINTPVILMISVISAIVTFLTIGFVEGLCLHWESNLIKTVNYDVVNWRQVEIIDKQKEKVFAGPADGLVPYQQAKETIIERYQPQVSAVSTSDGGD